MYKSVRKHCLFLHIRGYVTDWTVLNDLKYYIISLFVQGMVGCEFENIFSCFIFERYVFLNIVIVYPTEIETFRLYHLAIMMQQVLIYLMMLLHERNICFLHCTFSWTNI